jgi:cell cycle checkpoint protein
LLLGFAFLDRSLFTTFNYKPVLEQSPSSPTTQPDAVDPPPFQISLPALLETLQILGLTESTRKDANPYNRDNFRSTSAFSSHVLGLPTSSLCRLTYTYPSSSLRVHISEPGISTTCDLTTYDPPSTLTISPPTHDVGEAIPFARDALALKIIMHSAYLADALAELASTEPDRLVLTAQRTKPFFVLESEGALGSASVEFSHSESSRAASGPGANSSSRASVADEKDSTPATATAAAAAAPALLETFQVAQSRVTQAYKFALIRNAARAMQLATKVSVRMDDQGVLSLQFMIEIDGGEVRPGGGAPAVSFVDFRFVPFVGDGEEDEERGGSSDGEEDEEGDDELGSE